MEDKNFDIEFYLEDLLRHASNVDAKIREARRHLFKSNRNQYQKLSAHIRKIEVLLVKLQTIKAVLARGIRPSEGEQVFEGLSPNEQLSDKEVYEKIKSQLQQIERDC